jgi:hypothetical protein
VDANIRTDRIVRRDGIELNARSMKVPICMFSPRPVAPSSGIPPISSPNRTQRVQ